MEAKGSDLGAAGQTNVCPVFGCENESFASQCIHDLPGKFTAIGEIWRYIKFGYNRKFGAI